MQMVAAAKLRRAQEAAEAAGTGKDDVHLLIVCTSERGLCGGFNSQIARLTVKIITVGKKGADILRRDLGKHIIDHVDLRDVKQLGFVNADAIGHKIIALYNEGVFDIATLFYSEFKSVISQIPTAQQLVPASAVGDVFRALLENAASEQGARMSAMDNATRNAGDMINKLTMSYNRQRQAQITKELIEIISGAEAL
uniref:ATP synthase subunit gamma, mitochondrial n=1 Tax=Elaeophora elaphi TaxID=1147741 RepID=A0A0R3RM07_9BILA